MPNGQLERCCKPGPLPSPPERSAAKRRRRSGEGQARAAKRARIGGGQQSGRFISADPYVQYPFWGQGLNRYSYGFNNPMSGSDPTGFGWFEKIFGDSTGWEAAAAFGGFGAAVAGGAYVAYLAQGGSVSAGGLAGASGLGGAYAIGEAFMGLNDPGANATYARPTGELGQGALYYEGAGAPPAGADERLAGNEWMDMRQLTPEQRAAYLKGVEISAQFILGLGGLLRGFVGRAAVIGCFAGDTGILTVEGVRPISEVDVDDKVWSFDSERQEWRWMPVTKIFVHEHTGPMFAVDIAGVEIQMTSNHPICVAEGTRLSTRAKPHDIGSDPLACGNGGRWVEADDLEIGDLVVGADGLRIVNSITRSESSRLVYNLQVEGTHSYSVGAVGLLVHNKGAWATFANQLAARYASEVAAAASVGVRPMVAGGPGFTKLVNQGTIKFVVTEGGELIVAPHTVRGVEISHAVLSGGRPVLTAGQAEIATAGGKYVGLNISNHSGHFMPSEASLVHAKQAFRALGIVF